MRAVFAGWLCLTIATQAFADEASFVDTFETFDTERWYISDGWSNGSHQSCTWSNRNVRHENAQIILSLTDEQKGERAFSCAEIQTKAFFGYGTYEVRMKAAAANPGIVSAFFTFTGPPHGNPHDELDFEFIGDRLHTVDATYHAKGNGGRPAAVNLDFDATTGFHDYAIHWTPDRITWYADGKVVREVAKTDGEDYPTTPGKIYISLWSGSPELKDWLREFHYPGKPLEAEYQRIAFTKLGDPCQFSQSIVCTRQPQK